MRFWKGIVVFSTERGEKYRPTYLEAPLRVGRQLVGDHGLPPSVVQFPRASADHKARHSPLGAIAPFASERLSPYSIPRARLPRSPTVC